MVMLSLNIAKVSKGVFAMLFFSINTNRSVH